jgi:hypothetical protein
VPSAPSAPAEGEEAEYNEKQNGNVAEILF